jgi:hypothetical protein
MLFLTDMDVRNMKLSNISVCNDLWVTFSWIQCGKTAIQPCCCFNVKGFAFKSIPCVKMLMVTHLETRSVSEALLDVNCERVAVDIWLESGCKS